MQTSTPRAPAPRPRDASAILFTSPNTGPARTSLGSKEAVSEEDMQDQVTVSGATGSAEALVQDDVDSAATPDLQRARVALERLQDKIGRTRDQIREEQTARDDNVNEYLKLAASADKQQLMRIKAVFEKKNQKSAQAIAGLQRKLEAYSRKLRDLEATVARGADNAGHHRQPREVLRDMGQGLKNVGGNIRDGISGLSGTVMSKPREFAHLIKNKFGSADNINSLGKSSFYTGVEDSSEEDAAVSGQGRHHGSATLPAQGTRPPPHGSEEGAPSDCSSATSESLPPSSGRHNHSHGSGQQAAAPAPPHHVISPKHHVTAPAVSLEHIYEEIHEVRDELARLRTDFDALKSNVQAEQQFTSQALLDERFRVERLEEQLNDLTELHQTEVENLKTQVADSEEKVQYQSEERLRDIHEMLEACQTKISKMEHQQHQHQQYVTLEGIHNSNARALVVKLINVVLTVLQVVLLLVATTAGIAMPFLRTRLRVLTTVLLVGGVVFIVRQWPEVRDVGSHLMRHMKQALAVK